MGLIRVQGNADAPTWVIRPKGVYDLQIEDVEETTASTGTAQLKIRAIITGSERGNNIGETVTFFLALTEKACSRLADFLRQAGVYFEQDLEGFNFDPDLLIGASVRGTCRHRVYGGHEQEDWGNWSRAPGAPTPQAPMAMAPPPSAPEPAQQQPAQGYPFQPQQPQQPQQQQPQQQPQPPPQPPSQPQPQPPQQPGQMGQWPQQPGQMGQWPPRSR